MGGAERSTRQLAEKVSGGAREEEDSGQDWKTEGNCIQKKSAQSAGVATIDSTRRRSSSARSIPQSEDARHASWLVNNKEPSQTNHAANPFLTYLSSFY